MLIDINGTQIHFQIVPLYGLSIGALYYDPNLEPDRQEKVDPEDWYAQITIMFLIFGIHLNIWKAY